MYVVATEPCFIYMYAGDSEGEEVWEDLDGGLDYELDFDTASIPPDATHVESQFQRALVVWVVGFLIQLQAKHYIPDNALNMLLKFFYTTFCILGQFSGFVSGMVAHFPSSLHRLKKTTLFSSVYAFCGMSKMLENIPLWRMCCYKWISEIKPEMQAH